MSSEAITWVSANAREIGGGGRGSGNRVSVMKTVAAYCDVAGRGFAAVSAVAEQVGLSDRQVQRCLEDLKKRQWLLKTDDTRLYCKRRYPVYQLPLERGYATYRQRKEAERQARGVTQAPRQCGMGDTNATHRGDANVAHTGDANVTQRKEDNRDVKEGVCERTSTRGTSSLESPGFSRTASQWAATATERFSRPKARAAWLRQIEQGAIEEDLELTAQAYLRQAGEVRRGRCMAMHTWLDEQRWEPWLEQLKAPQEPKVRTSALKLQFPDSGIRTDCLAAMGEDRVKSILDPSLWDEPTRTITPFSTDAAKKLRSYPMLWKRHRVTIAEPHQPP